MMVMERLWALWASGRVTRFHQNPLMAHLNQTNAEHQWGCFAILMALHPNPSRDLIVAVLSHDMPELRAGDVSYVTKTKYPELREILDEIEFEEGREMDVPISILEGDERDWLSLVDRLEPLIYAHTYNPKELDNAGWAESYPALKELAVKLGCANAVCAFIDKYGYNNGS